jgi:Alpha-2,8-polysialyltransferase (POLYST)
MNNPVNFWIVNNPYHIYDVGLYNSKYAGENRFIAIEHRKILFPELAQVHYFEQYGGIVWFLLNYFSIKARVRKLGIRNTDRLFVFNGQEHTNNILLSLIARKYCRNIFIVDDGSSGYQFYLAKTVYSERLSDCLKQHFFSVFGVKYDVMIACKLYYLCLHRSFVKTILFPYNVAYDGKINVQCFNRKFETELLLNEHQAIFLSQPVYMSDPGYLSFNDYAVLLTKIMRLLAARYEKVYLKLHPNDNPELLYRITGENIPHIEIIEGGPILEHLLSDLTVKNLISFNSNALLTSFGSKRKTIWLYKFISEQCRLDFEYLDHIVPMNNGIVIEHFEQI